jgi:hypothetical protein
MLTYQGNIITKHTDVNNWINPFPNRNWKLLVEPTGRYVNLPIYGHGQALYTTWPNFVRPEWLVGNDRIEIRGKVQDGQEWSGSNAYVSGNITIPEETIYNKYLLLDFYGWYYCEGHYTSTVHLTNGNLRCKLTSSGPTIYDVTFTPSHVVTTIAQYPQNDTNTLTFNQSGYTQTFVQDNGYRLINFKCLIDKVHNKLYNLVQDTAETYDPYIDVEHVTWNYMGELNPSDTNYANLFTGNGVIYLYAENGSYDTGITNWWQSGMTWSNLTISGCSDSNLYISYR